MTIRLRHFFQPECNSSCHTYVHKCSLSLNFYFEDDHMLLSRWCRPEIFFNLYPNLSVSFRGVSSSVVFSLNASSQMINTGKFVGRTAIITGASRGIGKEIALKLAKDGANIVVAAKTSEPHPKLPGTIHTAVEDIEKAGGKGLACVVDVRDEDSVMNAVQETVKNFGGIDILVNNASAISLTGTLETTMKKYDLMHHINTRGTFLMSQKCIPYLKKGNNPHILNISPPLAMEKHWFASHVAYTMAKYGMSMCVLGMHEELRPFNIAVNALWPKTAIWTAAMEMLSKDAKNNCRKPEIIADAAYTILSKNSREYTGHFAIDEDILRSEGVTDFEQYAIQPGAPLMPDFFLPGQDYIAFNKSPAQHSPDGHVDINEILAEAKRLITPERVQKAGAIYQFNLKTSAGDMQVYFDLKNGNGGVHKSLGENEKADVTFTTDAIVLQKLLRGELSAAVAFTTGKLKIVGDMAKAALLSGLLQAAQDK